MKVGTDFTDGVTTSADIINWPTCLYQEGTMAHRGGHVGNHIALSFIHTENEVAIHFIVVSFFWVLPEGHLGCLN